MVFEFGTRWSGEIMGAIDVIVVSVVVVIGIVDVNVNVEEVVHVLEELLVGLGLR
jgi:hypothetical protein